MHQLDGHFEQPRARYQRDRAPQLALGTINVIFYKPKGDAGTCLRIMSVGSGPELEDRSQARKKARMVARAHFRFFRRR